MLGHMYMYYQLIAIQAIYKNLWVYIVLHVLPADSYMYLHKFVGIHMYYQLITIQAI